MFGLLSTLYLCIFKMCKMCARCVQDVCKVCTRCVQGVRKMCARCVQGVRKMCARCNDEVADMLVDMKVNKVANEVARRAPRLVGHMYSVQYWCFCFVSWRLSFVCIWIMRGHLCSFHLHTADRRNNAWHCTSSLIIRTTVSWKSS